MIAGLAVTLVEVTNTPDYSRSQVAISNRARRGGHQI